MKKRILLSIVAMLLYLGNIMAQVASGVCGDNLTWKLTDEGELVIEGTGAMTDYDNHSAPWFAYKDEILTVTIKPGVTTIGDYAIGDCGNLTTVTIPESVTSIGVQAFQYCYKLTSVTLSEGLETIKWGAFAECQTLPSIVIPESVTTIGNYAFTHCYALTSINIPESVTSIGMYAFRYTALTSITCNAATPPSLGDHVFNGVSNSIPVYVPVASIDAYMAAGGWSAFTNIQPMGTCGDNLTWRITPEDELIVEGAGEMTSAPWFDIEKYRYAIKKATIMEGVTSIADAAFHYCTALTSISIPESVTSLGNHTFRICSSLTAVTIPEGVTSIGKEVFQHCENLTEVSIPEGVTSIGYFAFQNCKLSTITIPENVSSIGHDAFDGCRSLVSMTCRATIPPVLESSTFNNVNKSIPLYVPAASVEAYKAANGWSEFTAIQPMIIASGTCGDNLTWKLNEAYELFIEGTGEMYNYSNEAAAPWNEYKNSIKSVDIKDGVTHIGSWAFAQCSALKSVSISDSVTSIGGDAFRECSILEEIALPTGLTQLGTGVFLYCDALKSITVPEGVTKIGSDTFEFCPSLTSISFPSGLTEIGPWALKGAYNLASISCKATTPPSIGSEALSGVSRDVTVYVPASCIETYKNADGWSQFTNYQPLVIASGTCGDNLTWNLFAEGELVIEGTGTMTSAPWSGYKDTITEIIIKEGVTSIFERAFWDCNKVVKTTIPKGVTAAGYDVFNGCTGEIYVNSMPESDGGMMMGGFLSGGKFTKVTVGEGVTRIGDMAFFYLSNMTEIVLPESLTTIGEMAFADCRSLTTITIPANVTSISRYAFDYCSNLTSIICKGTVPPVCSGELFYGEGQEKTLFVPITAISSYQSAEQWKKFDYIVGTAKCGDALTCELWPDGKLLIMGDGDITSAPWNTYGELVKALVIEDGVTGIADNSFVGFNNLYNITSYAAVPPVCSADAFAGVAKTTPVYVPTDKLELYAAAEGWSEFINLTSDDSRILLDSYAEFSHETDELFEKITYIRNFSNTDWQELYVPFEIPVTEEFLADFDVADLNDIRQYDRDDDGVADETVLEAFKVTDGTLKANYPYLIRAKERGEKSITVTDATLYATEENSVDCSSIHEKFTFTATYSAMDASELSGCYTLCVGIWQPVALNASLGAFRFYLNIESRDGSAQAAKSIKIRVINSDGSEDNDGTTTAIDNMPESEIHNSEIIYDLQGRPVENPAKGMYIVNGKKFLYK